MLARRRLERTDSNEKVLTSLRAFSFESLADVATGARSKMQQLAVVMRFVDQTDLRYLQAATLLDVVALK
jgi:hypothetical protein